MREQVRIDLGDRSNPIIIGPRLLRDAAFLAQHIAARDLLNVTNETMSTHGRFDNTLLDVFAYGRRYALGARFRM